MKHVLLSGVISVFCYLQHQLLHKAVHLGNLIPIQPFHQPVPFPADRFSLIEDDKHQQQEKTSSDNAGQRACEKIPKHLFLHPVEKDIMQPFPKKQ